LELRAQAHEAAEKAEREAQPDWEVLAGNGRALLAERLKQGWTMSSENCSGYHCNDMPLTNFEGGPNSCVVCGGSGSGCDGAYKNYKPDEVIEEERALVSQELSRLLNMGWVLSESLCVRCLMPLVAEDQDVEEDLCILCGLLPENNPHLVAHDGGDVDNENVDSYDSYTMNNDSIGNGVSYNNEPYFDEDRSSVVGETIMTPLEEAVHAPVPSFGDENTNQAGRKLIAGWTLPNAALCHHCHGIQMSPPNSHEIGCINRGCPSALAAAYTFLPDPHESTGPVRLIGRGFSNKTNHEKKGEGEWSVQKDEECQQDQLLEYEKQNKDFEYNENILSIIHEEQNSETTEYDGPPLVVGGHHQYMHDAPSILSDDMSQVRSVASSALGVILVRLDDAKYELEEMVESGNADPQECAQKQMEITGLIEKLASAAVAMKQKE